VAWAAVLLLAGEWAHAQAERLDSDLNLNPPRAPSLAAKPAPAPDAADINPFLTMSPYISPAPRGEAGRLLPIFLEADQLSGKTNEYTKAEGTARLRRGLLTMRADELKHTAADNTAHAIGHVRVDRAGDVYTGPEAQLQLDTNAGFFLTPQYRFARTGAGGVADRIDFIDDQHAVAYGATYTSCTPDEKGDLSWVLTTSKVSMDFEHNEGVAENAVVRFMGVPILAAPVLSFPLSEERKSGWLPPTFEQSSRSGFIFAQPYYWNIAPNRDATLTPTYSTRRGFGLNTEFRYLEPTHRGSVELKLLPNDQVRGNDRWLVNLQQETTFDEHSSGGIKILKASDDDYWKDFTRDPPGVTRRLLSSTAQYERHLSTNEWGLRELGASDLSWYARVQDWQVLQDYTSADTRIVAPYRRAPQIGLASQGERDNWEWRFNTEVNRFINEDSSQPSGNRAHLTGSMAYPIQPWADTPGWTITPRLSFTAASYEMDHPLSNGNTQIGRAIPTASLDSAWVLERSANWFGRDYIQTLEPRLHYVRTPYVDQTLVPKFDSAPVDFNFDSIYGDNAFSGVDRVADANQLTAGLTSRVIDPTNGVEALRLGMVQRVLLADQRITADGTPQTQRLSNLLLLASTSVIPKWNLDSNLEYNSQIHRVNRSVLGVRYSPGPWRTVGLTYRLARGSSEQVDLGWQWPIAGHAPPITDDDSNNGGRPGLLDTASSARGTGCCGDGGTYYAVGRVSYSVLNNRVTDSLFGFEYDAGCWIGRILAEKTSISSTETTTRLMFQLELVGLSKLGSNPLRALKENIPGYRLLREERAPFSPSEGPEPFSSNE
jgi:LPS-assembly protein